MGAISIPLSQLEPRLMLQVSLSEPSSSGVPAPSTAAWPVVDVVRHDDEIDDLRCLLLEHATHPGLLSNHLARALAEASMGPNHLWEDLGLGSRDQLNALMQTYFSSLKALNVHNMRWKKFLYRMLCERADILICKSPHCEQCEDRPTCFDEVAG